MPTGYTGCVSRGEVTDFKVYALRCARAFGACIMLRDEPVTDEIPEFEPSDHHQKSLDDAKKKLDFDGPPTTCHRCMGECVEVVGVKVQTCSICKGDGYFLSGVMR